MSYSIKDEQGNWHQVTGDSVEVFLGATASAKGRIGQVPEPQAGDQDKFLSGDGSWKNVPNPQTMIGATPSAAGTGGLTPTPGAGDEDKVLQGNGTFGKKLQMDIVVQSNQYGYIGANNTFIPFKSQADIDAAVSAAKVGNATAADVLNGKTFTNSTTSGVVGTMPDNSTRTSNGEVPGIQSNYPNEPVRNGISSQFNTGTDGVRRFAMAPPKGYYPGSASYVGAVAQTKTCTPSTSQQTISPDSGKVLESVTVNAIQTQEKTVTAGTSAASVTPDSGKLLSKVTYNPTPSQSKSCTPSTSAQTVSPDSGKLLSSVTVNAISPQRSLGTAATGSGIDNTGPYVYMPYGWWPEYSGKSGSSYTYMTAAQAVAACPKQEKTVTAGTSASSVTPDNGKLLSKVTYNPTPTQEKTVTGSRSAQTVTPDSGKHLSKVTVNKYPDASGTFTTSTNGSAVDMGATNNYRYVNTTGVYNAGKKNALQVLYISYQAVNANNDCYGNFLIPASDIKAYFTKCKWEKVSSTGISYVSSQMIFRAYSSSNVEGTSVKANENTNTTITSCLNSNYFQASMSFKASTGYGRGIIKLTFS